MKKIFAFIILAFGFSLHSLAQTNTPTTATGPSGTATTATMSAAYNTVTSYNYIQSWTPSKPTTDTSAATFHIGTFNPAHVTTTYINGWGRHLMTIEHGPNGTVKDVLAPSDNRVSLTQTQLLPYSLSHNSKFQANPFSDEISYYNGLYSAEGGTSYSQSVTSLDDAIPNTRTYAPGKSFTGQSRGDTSHVLFNESSDLIVQFGVDTNNNLIGFGTLYSAHQLSIKSYNGASGAAVKEFYNKSGQLLCRKNLSTNHAWLSTYYVYNDLGRLAYILPPQAMGLTPYALTSGVFVNDTSLIYKYTYDGYGNVIERIIPGKIGPECVVYDNKLRPVLSQTPLLRTEGKWEFTIYDSRDRAVITGLITDVNTRATWQGWANGSVTPSGGITSGSLLDYIVNGFNGTYPSSITSCQLQQMNYYDTYPSFAAGSIDTSWSSNYIPSVNNVTPAAYMFTQGMLTASKVHVEDATSSFANMWITSTYFYDQKGHLIQTQTLNPWNTSNPDIATFQYNFLGQKVLDIIHHNSWSTCDKTSTDLVNYYNYDSYYGRLNYVQQKTDGGAYRTIASYSYDDLGRVSEKNYGGGVEVQDYKYNIRGQLQSINSDYVASPTTTAKTFGCNLYYDYGFSQPRYDGNIAGITWRGAGVSAPLRAYGYRYDVSAQLTNADFNRKSGSAWTNTTEDYTMTNVNYDWNGNITSMRQMGTPPGLSSPVPIDVLTYTYKSNSNQLSGISDSVKVNYNLGDFQDVWSSCGSIGDSSLGTGMVWEPERIHGPDPGGGGGGGGSGSTTIPCDDYAYDADGNLTLDSNKRLDLIVYNELDLPVYIQKHGSKGHIQNIYDASGTLLKKIVVDSSTATPHTDTYQYWGPFVYRNDSLLYFLHQDGRAVWHADSSFFRYDYFVTDHLGNVRTVVTANPSNPVDYFAGHELASASLESSIFANVDAVRDLKPYSTNPYDVDAAHLNGSDTNRRIGTAILLQVMAGDQFDVSAQSYWDADSAGMSKTAGDNLVLGSILSALTGGAGGWGNTESGASYASALFNNGNYLGVYAGLMDSLRDYSRPAAYINYVVFNSQMQIVPGESGIIQVSAESGSWQAIGKSNLTIGQNGYLAVYMSDASFMDVHFDALSITHYAGSLEQEQHYYPFGLAINMGTAAGTMPANHKFETNEVHTELGVNQSDFNFRQYDYQVGRFTGVDLLADHQEGFSPYHGFANNPANLVDPMGLDNGKGNHSVIKVKVSQNEDGSYQKETWYDDNTATIEGIDYEEYSSSGAGGNGDGESEGYQGLPSSTTSTEADFVKMLTSGGGNAQGASGTASGPGGTTPAPQTPTNQLPPYQPPSGFWYTAVGQGIWAVSDWFNYNINPLYSGVNGIQGLVTQQDLLSGQSMSRTEAGVNILMAVVPGAMEDNTILKTGENVAQYTIYHGLDENGVVKYVGITSRNPLIRFAEHSASNDVAKRSLQYRTYQVVDNLRAARVVEQKLINTYGLEKNGGLLLNKINSIAPKYWWEFGITK